MDERALPRGGRTRLAPTPSGFLHAGNAFNFLVTARLAEMSGARLLLRIDDLDAGRVREAYVEDIFRSLEWLGIGWDEGPSGPADLITNWSQRHRIPEYLRTLDRLRGSGALYACSCSRGELRRSGIDGAYTGLCRNKAIPLDTPGTAWRLALPSELTVELPPIAGPVRTVDLVRAMGDPVLRQRDGQPAYQLASLLDDAHFGVTFIVRGEDLAPSSACQMHLANLLGMEGFKRVRLLHHPLLHDPSGGKLSKSAGATSLRSLREAGGTPDDLRMEADAWLEQALRG